LILDLDEIEIDNPLCYTEISSLLVFLHKSKCICEKFISKLPQDILTKFKENQSFSSHFSEILSLVSEISSIKDKYKDLIQNYLYSGMTEDIKNFFEANESHVPICHFFVRRALEIGFDRQMNDRERIS
jgi:hypothetical protein